MPAWKDEWPFGGVNCGPSRERCPQCGAEASWRPLSFNPSCWTCGWTGPRFEYENRADMEDAAATMREYREAVED
jgi:hypothetical protein